MQQCSRVVGVKLTAKNGKMTASYHLKREAAMIICMGTGKRCGSKRRMDRFHRKSGLP